MKARRHCPLHPGVPARKSQPVLPLPQCPRAWVEWCVCFQAALAKGLPPSLIGQQVATVPKVSQLPPVPEISWAVAFVLMNPHKVTNLHGKFKTPQRNHKEERNLRFSETKGSARA